MQRSALKAESELRGRQLQQKNTLYSIALLPFGRTEGIKARYQERLLQVPERKGVYTAHCAGSLWYTYSNFCRMLACPRRLFYICTEAFGASQTVLPSLAAWLATHPGELPHHGQDSK